MNHNGRRMVMPMASHTSRAVRPAMLMLQKRSLTDVRVSGIYSNIHGSTHYISNLLRCRQPGTCMLRQAERRLFSSTDKGSNNDGDSISTENQDNKGEIDRKQSSSASTVPSQAPTISNKQHDSVTVERLTRQWLQNVVIGLNLCPFAEKPLRDKQLDISIEWSDDETTIIETVYKEMVRRIDEPGTTLVVCPCCHPDDFISYMDASHTIDEVIQDNPDLYGTVQVASFHPLYQFEGSSTDDVDNWTNRSPYPIFHVLREVEVEKAVDKIGGDASKVWKRNVNLLEAMEDELGQETLTRFVQSSGEANSSLRSRISALLKRFRIK
jgi:uncharacterized protein